MNQLQGVHKRRGVTLFELLMALAAIAIFIGFFFAALNRAYLTMDSLKCKNNLKQIGIAIKDYEASTGYLPCFEERAVPDGGKTVIVSIYYQLLEFVEQDALLKKTYPDAAGTKIAVFTCPADTSTGTAPNGYAFSNYAANTAIFHGSPQKRLTTNQAMEASSATIMAAERLQMCGDKVLTQWADTTKSVFGVAGVNPDFEPIGKAPPGMTVQVGATQKTCDEKARFQSAHPHQVNVLRGDAGTSIIPPNFDAKSLNFYCLGVGRTQWVSADYTPWP